MIPTRPTVDLGGAHPPATPPQRASSHRHERVLKLRAGEVGREPVIVAGPRVGSYCCPMTADQVLVLRSARTVLLIDFPSRDVPDALAHAGLSVMAQGGPGPQDFFSYQPDGEEVREVRTGRSSYGGGPHIRASSRR